MDIMTYFYRLRGIPKRCACCGQQVDAYLPLPAEFTQMYKTVGIDSWRLELLNEQEYQCPHCGAADRERAYALWMEKSLPRDKAFRMLDIAPARPLGNFVKRCFPKAEYKTGDLFMEGVDYQLDIMDMKQLANESLDFFVCSHVLEHVADDRQAMRELRRILKPSGCGILVVPLDLNQEAIDEDIRCQDEMERWRRFGQDDHVRKYSKQGYLTRLRTAGLDVEQCGTGFFGCRAVWENSLSDTAEIYIVRRK